MQCHSYYINVFSNKYECFKGPPKSLEQKLIFKVRFFKFLSDIKFRHVFELKMTGEMSIVGEHQL